MKKTITFLSIMTLAIMIGFNVKAQDFSSLEGSNYYLMWLDSDTEGEFEISDKIIQDLRPNWDNATNPDGERALYIWSNTYSSESATGKGSFDQIGGFLNFNVIDGGWSGLGLCMRDDAPASFAVDFTQITDDYRFHMAFKSTMSKAHEVQVFGGADEKQAALFSIGVGEMGSRPNITPNFQANQWNIIDIPVSTLKSYGFSNRTSFMGNYFVVLSGPTPNNIAIDAIFFYNPAVSGVKNVKADKLSVIVTKQIVEVLNAEGPIEVYNLTGSLVKRSVEPIFGVEELTQGAYILKSGNAVSKIIIK